MTTPEAPPPVPAVALTQEHADAVEFAAGIVDFETADPAPEPHPLPSEQTPAVAGAAPDELSDTRTSMLPTDRPASWIAPRSLDCWLCRDLIAKGQVCVVWWDGKVTHNGCERYARQHLERARVPARPAPERAAPALTAEHATEPLMLTFEDLSRCAGALRNARNFDLAEKVESVMRSMAPHVKSLRLAGFFAGPDDEWPPCIRCQVCAGTYDSTCQTCGGYGYVAARPVIGLTREHAEAVRRASGCYEREAGALGGHTVRLMREVVAHIERENNNAG